MQDWQRDPQNEEGESTDEGTKCVGEDHATSRTTARGRAGEALVEDLIETVEDRTSADNEVPSKTVFGLGFRGGRGVGVRGGAGVGRDGGGVAVGDDEDTDDGNEDGEGFVGAEGLFEEWD